MVANTINSIGSSRFLFKNKVTYKIINKHYMSIGT